MGVQGLCDQGVAQDGLQGLHVRTGLDGQGGVSVTQRADDRPRYPDALILQGRGPHPVPSVRGVLPSSPWSAQ